MRRGFERPKSQRDHSHNVACARLTHLCKPHVRWTGTPWNGLYLVHKPTVTCTLWGFLGDRSTSAPHTLYTYHRPCINWKIARRSFLQRRGHKSGLATYNIRHKSRFHRNRIWQFIQCAYNYRRRFFPPHTTDVSLWGTRSWVNECVQLKNKAHQYPVSEDTCG